MGNVGIPEILVIAIFALLIFGPQKLPELARTVGRALSEFKKATSGLTEGLRLDLDDKPSPTRSRPAESKDERPERRPGPR